MSVWIFCLVKVAANLAKVIPQCVLGKNFPHRRLRINSIWFTFFLINLCGHVHISRKNFCKQLTWNFRVIFMLFFLLPVSWPWRCPLLIRSSSDFQTHPTQSCFMSSVDVHTHYSYQVTVESMSIYKSNFAITFLFVGLSWKKAVEAQKMEGLQLSGLVFGLLVYWATLGKNKEGKI